MSGLRNDAGRSWQISVNKKAARARIQKLKQERKKKDLNAWYRNATPSERIMYDNETHDLEKQIRDLREKLKKLTNLVEDHYRGTHTSSGTTYSTVSNTTNAPPHIGYASDRVELDEILSKIDFCITRCEPERLTDRVCNTLVLLCAFQPVTIDQRRGLD